MSEPHSGSPASHNNVPMSLLLIPFVMVLLAQTIMMARDFRVFHYRHAQVLRENAQMESVLKKSSDEIQAVRKLQKDLEQAAQLDPKAQKILDDFFPKKPADQGKKGV